MSTNRIEETFFQTKTAKISSKTIEILINNNSYNNFRPIN